MGTGGVISAVFSAMMDVIWSGQYTAIKPQRFLRLFASQVNACLADGHQHDASEFQLFLLDALHEDTNQVTKRVSFEQNYRGGPQIVSDARDYEKKSRLFACSPVNRIFNLQTVSELSCSACGEQSATFEECSLITVELPMHTSRTSLQQCLSSHFSQTTLDGDSRWNCPRCRAPKRASRLTKLWSLPPVVVVHLKRFSIENGDYAKNTMAVDFDPTKLDLSEYLHENSPESAEPYKLYAVTNHSGRLNSGHYTALVCHGTTGEWLRFDDESVSTSSASGINIKLLIRSNEPLDNCKWLDLEFALEEMGDDKDFQTLKRFQNKIFRHALRHINVGNCLSIWRKLLSMGSQLADEAFHFILYHLSESVLDKTICYQFYRLSFEQIFVILDHDKLKVRTEDDVLEIINAWIDTYDGRYLFRHKLLGAVRVAGLSGEKRKSLIDNRLIYLLSKKPRREPRDQMVMFGGWYNGRTHSRIDIFDEVNFSFLGFSHGKL
ncbi:unnamed protein product [Angiostrongylus costaricensis]|uniref:ubiquitinyl hydrolase 1 n=1 Tax=Angiostrongylus costaricensis TaxID=334426 RepID=A0A0R3PP72_ANGCS|nr:unnamed protein product [Angiostrongylus costaricensis]